MAIISVILLSGITPFLSRALGDLKPKTNIGIVEEVEEYLYLSEVTETEYEFRPKGACYVIVDIVGIDFTSFILDDGIDEEIYEVSYGSNIIPIEFPISIQNHTIRIEQDNLPNFKSLTIEPLFLAEGEIEVNLDQDTEINFNAGGPISILTRINFSYNWLRVELQNESGESTMLKRIHDTAEYPEVDPLFYCLFVERGTYIRYDIDLKPGEYNLILRGNGSLEYKIVVNSDWDKDNLDDVDEIQQEDFYNFNLDPTSPDAWGFYQNADDKVYFSEIGDNYTNGHFTFYAPETTTYHRLDVKVDSGQFTEMIVNNDSVYFEGQVFNSSNDSEFYGFLGAGWHNIYYKHKVNLSSEIKFLINNIPVKVLKFPELIDTDGDGIKDLEEFSNSLDPSKVDTDEDGIPDNLDSSPLAKMELDSEKIHQFVIPTDDSKDSIINIQIKKPELDYSTNGIPRLWRGIYNVSIYPVLRLFGSECEDLRIKNYDSHNYYLNTKSISEWDSLIYHYFSSGFRARVPYDPPPGTPEYNQGLSELDLNRHPTAWALSDGIILIRKSLYDAGNRLWAEMDKQTLEISRGKEVECIFKSDEAVLKNYPENGVGDPLPTSTDNPEYILRFPKPATDSIDYSILIPQGHSSKADGLLDLRFDIIWLVTYYDRETGETALLHYYDFEENITVQSITMREIANIDYILGSPDNFTESQILWNLNQNPALGTPEEFGVLDDIVGQDSVNYFNLIESAALDRKNHPLEDYDTEVLYITGLFQNYDVLNKISLQNLPTPDFETVYQGDYEACFSSYSISNLYEDQDYSFGDSEIQGEHKMLYQIFYNNFTENGVENIQKRASIMGIPIAMELCTNSKVLKVYQAQGLNVPLDEIPWDDSNLSDKITTLQYTYIEQENQISSIPLVNFEDGVDIVKEQVDFRKQEVELSHLFFISQSIDVFQYAVDEFWDLLNSANNSLSEFYDLVSNNQIPFSQEELGEHIELLINKINEFKQESYSELSDQLDFFQFAQSIELDASNLQKLSKDYHLNELDYIPHIAKFFKFGGGLDKHLKNLLNFNAPKSITTKSSLKSSCIGAAGSLLGVFMMYHSIQEVSQLKAANKMGLYDDNQIEFMLRYVKAVSTVVIGALVGLSGVLQFVSSLGVGTMSFVRILTTVIKYLGFITFCVTFIVFFIDTSLFIKKLVDRNVEVEDVINFVMSSLAFLSGALLLVGGITAVVGAAIGIAVAGVALIFMIINHLLNDPDLSINDERTTMFFPDETLLNIRRNGGLEVGDLIHFILVTDIGGSNPFSIRTRIRIDEKFNGGWEGSWTEWNGHGWDSDTPAYAPGWGSYHHLITSIAGASPDLFFRLEFEADYWKFNILGKLIRQEDGIREGIDQYLEIPALENTISLFNSSTVKYISYSEQLRRFYEEREDFRYKDAYITATSVLNYIQKYEFTDDSNLHTNNIPSVWLIERIEGMLKNPPSSLPWGLYPGDYKVLDLGDINYGNVLYKDMTPEMLAEFRNFDWSPYLTGQDYIKFKDPYASSQNPWNILFKKLVTNYFESGVRAFNPSYIYTYYDCGIKEPLHFLDHYYAYEERGDLRLLVPKYWYTPMEPHVQAYKEFEELLDNLPLSTNIRTDYESSTFDVDHALGVVNVNLVLALEPHSLALDDTQKEVVFTITAPEEFSISEESFTDSLSSAIDFTLTHNSPIPMHGVYYFDLKIYLDGEEIYEESIPIIIRGYSKIDFTQFEASEPIVPGEIFLAVNVINSGTYSEVLNISVTGTIPDNFIYKGFYPDDFIKNTLNFMFHHGESRIGLAINPPRHYTTKPGIYNYTIRILDTVNGIHDILLNDTFEVEKFYDMDFQLLKITPDDTIFDYQTAKYSFNLTNLGNVEQNFTIDVENVTFANEFLSNNTILLEPGEWKIVNLTLDPTGWGNQTFNINATSKNNKSIIQLNITINDDDTNKPMFTDFEIIDTPIDITINFKVLNENETITSDDCGLSNVSIYINGTLIANIPPPDSSATYFSFTIDDNGGEYEWFMELGIYEIIVVVTDNDDDVALPIEKLSSSINGSFETTFDDMREYVKWYVDTLNEKLQTSSDDDWRHPVDSHKKSLDEKLTALKHMIATLVFLDAYNKLLHDIKPKLTGLKNDENGNPWGNRVFKNAWVENPEFQEELQSDCNELLKLIQILMSVN